MTTKLKWGVLGFAGIARNNFIPALLKSTNSEFYAVASRDQAKLEECKQQFSCSKFYSDYDALLNDPEIQAVYIPLPNSLHKEWVLKAVERGKHVLCEKPITLNAAECEEIIRAAQENNVVVMEGFMYRYTDRIKKLQEILESGVIGKIRYINATYRFLLKHPNIRSVPELGGGSLYDVGSYPVNLVGMITNSMPESVSAECVLENGVDTIFSAVLKYPDGIIATINSGFNAFYRMYAEIIGTEGIIEVPDAFADNPGQITIVTRDGREEVEILKSDRFLLEVNDFTEAVLAGRQPMLSLEDTLRNMRVIDQLFESVQRG